jgi:hypothetical protein
VPFFDFLNSGGSLVFQCFGISHGRLAQHFLKLSPVVAHMLRPGGLLLSNNALMEFPGSPLRSIDYLTVLYSDDRPDDGDHIVWYQRQK